MISDIMSDAVDNIRELMLRRPETYQEIAPEIEAVLKQMDSLRSHFDSAPPNVGLRKWFDQRGGATSKNTSKI
jgi:hypothetical protein